MADKDSISRSMVLPPSLPFGMKITTAELAGYGFINKFGAIHSFGAGGFVDVWDLASVYVPPTTARVHDLVSTSANDSGVLLASGTATDGGSFFLEDLSANFIGAGVAAGDFVLNDSSFTLARILVVVSATRLVVSRWASPASGLTFLSTDATKGTTYRVVTNGAATGMGVVHIQGLDWQRLFQEEFIILNGLTPVSTTKAYSRMFRLRGFATEPGVRSYGCAGNVTATAQTDLTVSAILPVDHTQTEMAIYSVPRNKNAFLTNWRVNLTGRNTATCEVRLRAGELDGPSYITDFTLVRSSGTSGYVRSWDEAPPYFAGGADVWVEAETDAPNSAVNASFTLILRDA